MHLPLPEYLALLLGDTLRRQPTSSAERGVGQDKPASKNAKAKACLLKSPNRKYSHLLEI